MSQFDEIVRNIALETEKCNYNPEIDLNWCNLPMEMRYECVKLMDFKTRTRLSATSKPEKSLVEAKKIQFQRLHIDVDDNQYEWKVTAVTKIRNCEYQTVVETMLNPDYRFISAILKNGEVKNLRLYAAILYDCYLRPLLDQWSKFAPFRFERISVFGIAAIAFFVENCPNLKKVDFHNRYGVPFPFEEMLNIPWVTNINEFRLSHVYPVEINIFLYGLVQKWIDNDVEVGKSVQCIMQLPWPIPREKLVDTFAEKFADRIIDNTAEEVRIRMDNPTTQILLRHIGPRKVQIDTSMGPSEITHECFSCKVIPIDMPKSEYGKGDGWIQSIYEKGLKRNGKLEKAMEFDAEDQDIWGHLWS